MTARSTPRSRPAFCRRCLRLIEPLCSSAKDTAENAAGYKSHQAADENVLPSLLEARDRPKRVLDNVV